MSHLFYDTFGMEKIPFIFLCGDDSVERMRAILARELSGRGKSALFISNVPMPFPVEGQVLVDIKPDLLKQKIDPRNPSVFYLCSAVKDDLLMPVESTFFSQWSAPLPQTVTLISTIAPNAPLNWGRPNDSLDYVFINVLGYPSLEEHFNKFINQSDAQSERSFEENLKNHWYKWVAQYCPNPEENKRPIQRLLFLNQVKSLIDENHAISLVRNLTEMYDHIYIGDINEYKLKEV